MPKLNIPSYTSDENINRSLYDLEKALVKYFEDNIDITTGNSQLVELLIATFVDYYKVDMILQTEFKSASKKHNSISISSLMKTKIQLRNCLFNYFNELTLTPSARAKLKKLKDITGEDEVSVAISKIIPRD